MLHLRAVCPPDRTEQALGILRAHAGTAHLIVHRGAAVDPAGDLVEADIALLAGAAGMLSMTSAKSAALVGVFISVTTVPAAGHAVVAAVAGQWDRCLYSAGQLLVNLIGIVAAAAIVLMFRSRRQRSASTERPLSRG